MPVKLVLFSSNFFDSMIAPILLYGIEIWLPAGKFTFDSWDRTEVEQIHTSLLKQYLGLNRSVQNKMVRSEFGRLPLIIDAHTRTWNYIKYILRINLMAKL